MYKPRDVVERRGTNDRTASELEPVPGGLRRRLVATGDYEVCSETLLPHAYQGAWQSTKGHRTYVVLGGALWIREAKGQAMRLVRGQSFTTAPDRAFEIATGAAVASILLIESPGFAASLERVPGDREPSPRPDASALTRSVVEQARRVQGTFAERTARANAAQGLSRAQPHPGRAQTAADLSFGFSVPGTNLAPVVPEP